MNTWKNKKVGKNIQIIKERSDNTPRVDRTVSWDWNKQRIDWVHMSGSKISELKINKRIANIKTNKYRWTME